MKKLGLLLLASVLLSGVLAHDLYLLPLKFFLSKGDLMTVNMYIGDDFAKEIEKPVNRKDVNLFKWFTPIQTENLLTMVTDSVKPVISKKKLNFQGLGLLAVNRNHFHIALTPEKFTSYLKEEHIDNILKMRETMPAKKVEREKYVRFIKTLVMVEKADGDLYKKVIGQTLEIILLQNPYMLKIGSSLQAKVLFRGRPLEHGGLEVLCQQPDGKINKRAFYSNKAGMINFELNTPGSYMVRITHMLPSTTPDADWESFWASYTFGFRN